MVNVSFKCEDKVKIALALDDLGVDSIEAGFPMVSEGEFKAVREISKEVVNSEVVALCRSDIKDIDRALDADVDAVHIFIATSDIHLKYKLRISREEALKRAVKAVEYAKSHGLTVEFSAEDATRTEWNVLANFFQKIVNAGADRLDIADTVGVMWPSRIAKLVEFIRNNVKGNYLLSVHCHNDFGMATANSVAAVEAGADQVHVTVNGIGERAGNAALEEVVSAIHFLLGYKTGIKLEKIRQVSELVANLAGISIPPNKPIIGANVFAHKSGIHVHGVIANPETYEPIRPELIGAERKIRLGKHSGKHAIKYAIKMLGFEPKSELINEVLRRVKEIGDKGVELSISDLERIIREILKDQQNN